MGLYDTLYINKNILEKYEIRCKTCGKYPKEDFQTKDLECCMYYYYLRYEDENNPLVARLYKLDPPSDKRFWHEWTDKEIEEYNNIPNETNRFKFLFKREKGGGHWLDEAFLPQNRRQRSMGELPHQYIETYSHCSTCKDKNDWTVGWVEISIKFTDGIVEDIRQVEMKK